MATVPFEYFIDCSIRVLRSSVITYSLEVILGGEELYTPPKIHHCILTYVCADFVFVDKSSGTHWPRLCLMLKISVGVSWNWYSPKFKNHNLVIKIHIL